MKALTSKEILDKVSDSSINKAGGSFKTIFLLAILAGAYIAIGGFASTMASYNLTSDPATFGLGRLVSGCVFPVGLMMVVLCGAELFTGNCLMVTGVADKKIRLGGMFRNWAIVYIGNLIGALIFAYFVFYTDSLDASNGLLGAMVIKTAIGKVNLDFGKAVVLGIMCNWLVCLAVWMATGAQATVSKIFASFFIILPFVIGGFEHCVANMYFIPVGMMAATNEAYVNVLGLDVSSLTVGAFVLKNLVPVTIGNIIGGSGFVGMMYWLIHRK
ncbi:MAG: formate/nitrite transporter family protein [Firmicutes bacterium]|nr:formate/nitrite transporter family protein [Bacillota bacterium]